MKDAEVNEMDLITQQEVLDAMVQGDKVNLEVLIELVVQKLKVAL